MPQLRLVAGKRQECPLQSIEEFGILAYKDPQSSNHRIARVGFGVTPARGSGQPNIATFEPTGVRPSIPWATGPNPSPKWFGFHEVFHSFTLGGWGGATGGGWQNHDILNWQFDSLADTNRVISIGSVAAIEGDHDVQLPSQLVFQCLAVVPLQYLAEI